MHPLLLLGIAIGIGKLLVEAFSNNPEFDEIDHSDIYKDFLVNQDDDDFTEKVLKQKLTHAINRVIRENKGFKIGKTGNPKERNSNHKKYDKMFLLCSSTDEVLINKLEAYYNSKYINDKKNDNKKDNKFY